MSFLLRPRVWLSGVHGVVWQQVWGSLTGTQQLPGSHMEVCVVLHGWSRPAPPKQPCWRTLSPVWVPSVTRAQCELAPGPRCYPSTLNLQPAGRRGARSSAGSSWRCRSSSCSFSFFPLLKGSKWSCCWVLAPYSPLHVPPWRSLFSRSFHSH